MLHEGARAHMPFQTYYYRRRLRSRELLAVLGLSAGAAAGVFAVTFYFVRMFVQRTPLLPPDSSTDPAGGARSLRAR